MDDLPESLRVQIITAAPGDLVVISSDRVVTLPEAATIKRQIEALLPPGVKAAVMSAGLHLDGVIRPDPNPQGG